MRYIVILVVLIPSLCFAEVKPAAKGITPGGGGLSNGNLPGGGGASNGNLPGGGGMIDGELPECIDCTVRCEDKYQDPKEQQACKDGCRYSCIQQAKENMNSKGPIEVFPIERTPHELIYCTAKQPVFPNEKIVCTTDGKNGFQTTLKERYSQGCVISSIVQGTQVAYYLSCRPWGYISGNTPPRNISGNTPPFEK